MTRGVRNNNPFNIKLSNNSWLGKMKKNTDGTFEQFRTIDYGLRAGMQLLRGYIARGYDTPARIINRFAPSSENNVSAYISFVCDGPLHPHDNLSVNSLNFYNLCAKICMYESQYHFDYDHYVAIMKKFRL